MKDNYVESNGLNNKELMDVITKYNIKIQN